MMKSILINHRPEIFISLVIWGESSNTSSVFVYTKVFVDNLNDIKDTAFLKG